MQVSVDERNKLVLTYPEYICSFGCISKINEMLPSRCFQEEYVCQTFQRLAACDQGIAIETVFTEYKDALKDK